MPHGRGKGGGRGRGGRGAYYSPQVKRVRVPSEEQEESDVEVDPELLLDSLLACLTKKESLLDRFLTHLLQVPSLQEKIAQMVMSSLVTDSSSGDDATANADPNSTTADGSIKTSIANNFMSTIKDLTSAVNELKTELKSSTQRCDDLEQYSRRNNIIIANVPESEVTSTEGQVVNILNDYVDEAITPNDIDRCHRLKRNPKTNVVSQQKPSDIIVKFVSHKSVASILTKDPMEKLRANNLLLPEKSRIYIREDLTKKRASVLYKARQLKKAKLIKDAFSRDGTITIRMPQIAHLVVIYTTESQVKMNLRNSVSKTN